MSMNKLMVSGLTALVIGLGQFGLVEQARAEVAYLVRCTSGFTTGGQMVYYGTYRLSNGDKMRFTFDEYCPASITL